MKRPQFADLCLGLALLVVLALGATTPARADVAGAVQATTVITDLMTEVTQLSRTEFSGEGARVAAFDEVLPRYFLINVMAVRALPVHWETMSESERQSYLTAYRWHLARAIAAAYRDMAAGSWRVLGVRGAGEDALAVLTRHRDAHGDEHDVFWLLPRTAMKVVDINAEGILMSAQQADEFRAVIAAEGLPALIARLEAGSAVGPAGPAE